MPLPADISTRRISPQISVDVVGKRLRVTTRCFRAAMLGPASAGVGVRVPRLFGHGPSNSLDGGQLAQAPIEQEKDGMLESVLEFDVSKILLQTKDILAPPWSTLTTIANFTIPSSHQPQCFTCAARTWTFLPSQKASP